MQRCETCRFWNRAKRARWTDLGGDGRSILVEHAQCRRYAPSRLLPDHRSGTPDKVWPHVNASDWCGEHQPKEAGDAD